MFDAAGERTLDDVTRAELESRLGRPVLLAATLRDVAEALVNRIDVAHP